MHNILHNGPTARAFAADFMTLGSMIQRDMSARAAQNAAHARAVRSFNSARSRLNDANALNSRLDVLLAQARRYASGY